MNTAYSIRTLLLTGRIVGLIFAATMLTGFLSASVCIAADAPDYYAFDDMLIKNVSKGFVDYNGFEADPRLDEFIEQIGTMSPDTLTTDRERLALYINAYNALSIKGILNGGSPAKLFGRNRFFKRDEYVVLGEETTLYDLEREKIIAIGEPRIHFAIVCASLSCPRISNRAYTADNLDSELQAAARGFLNDPTRNRFDLERRIAFVSMIFKWYGEEFEAAGGSVQKYLARFVDDAEVQDALRNDEFKLKYEKYNWNLNGNFVTD